MQPTKGYLVLETQKVFEGLHFGHRGYSTGELVFNTGITGYQEILTDPSYCQQIITLTYPEIGNYGVNSKFNESSSVFATGLIVKSFNKNYSSYEAEASLEDLMLEHKIVGLSNIDTRSITKYIRDNGAMRAVISDDSQSIEELQKIVLDSPSMEGLDLTAIVSRKNVNHIQHGKYKLAVLDFGIKKSIIENLQKFDFDITIFPANSTFEQIIEINPCAYLLSNGPGDPASNPDIINLVKKIISLNKPILGICLGHQLMSIALGAKTYKLKFGHRGSNQPVKNLINNTIQITSHNHGFATDPDSFTEDMVISHINLNDNSVEGFIHKTKPFICVQFHPEANPGPNDANTIFDDFYQLVAKQ